LPEHHWLGTAVTVNEPLAQIRWHFYVDKIVTHEVQKFYLKAIQRYKEAQRNKSLVCPL